MDALAHGNNTPSKIANILLGTPPDDVSHVIDNLACSKSVNWYLHSLVRMLKCERWEIFDKYLLRISHSQLKFYAHFFEFAMAWYNKKITKFDVLVTFFHDVTCLLSYNFNTLTVGEKHVFVKFVLAIAKEQSLATISKQLCYIGRSLSQGYDTLGDLNGFSNVLCDLFSVTHFYKQSQCVILSLLIRFPECMTNCDFHSKKNLFFERFANILNDNDTHLKSSYFALLLGKTIGVYAKVSQYGAVSVQHGLLDEIRYHKFPACTWSLLASLAECSPPTRFTKMDGYMIQEDEHLHSLISKRLEQRKLRFWDLCVD